MRRQHFLIFTRLGLVVVNGVVAGEVDRWWWWLGAIPLSFVILFWRFPPPDPPAGNFPRAVTKDGMKWDAIRGWQRQGEDER